MCVARAGSIAAGFDLHRGNVLKTIAHGRDDCGARRRDKFTFNVTCINRLAFEEFSDGGRWNRNAAMGHLGHAAANSAKVTK